jgi:hypothetical protein
MEETLPPEIIKKERPRNMPQKIKVMQPEKFTGRDMFNTPRYATELLIPFLNSPNRVWECAAGDGNIARPLMDAGIDVFQTDIRESPDMEKFDFLLGGNVATGGLDCIVTNPPFSLKKKFVERCFYYDIPWALLIPADLCGWVIDAMKRGCQRIVPEKRIDYLTPNMLQNINEKSNIQYEKLQDVPVGIMRKYTSNFHSIWLTWGLGLGQQETYAPLTNEQKNRIF